ncbi:protoglobin domain-containing protein [Saprospira sp. CCB-QB6]|uniref:protoglobin domain-containing protein n=1 Tax=Saprospira sp. CCB-QB6 TaxID=3023936 RepID=UPI00234A1FE9|nr:protoglobin domain-containing protein [Saprospira sp. CCB-QB6]WCL81886.1 protoglobin domain-containing protein [Saprospira sp. CCB-QB6]
MQTFTAEAYKLHFYISEETLGQIRSVSPQILTQLPQLVDDFYERMLSYPKFSAYAESEAQVQHLKNLHLRYWQSFWAAKVDENYIQSRKRIGEVHARVGLPMDLYYDGIVLFSKLFKTFFQQEKIASFDLWTAYNELLNMDTALIVDRYNSISNEVLELQNASLSTPVAQIWEEILFLPIVGIMDSKRSKDIMETVLNQIASKQAKVFVLDISGVAIMDTAVANHLLKISKASRLMGCRCILSGISPAVAQTIVELGIQLDEIETSGSMKEALTTAFELSGLQIASL